MKNRFLVALALFSLIAAGCDRGNNDLGGSGFIEAPSVVVSRPQAASIACLSTRAMPFRAVPCSA
jgi:hypothetical protein